MAKNKISEWSATASNNTDVGGIDIAEGCAPSGINNAIREMMAQIKDQQSGTDADNFTVGGNLSVTGTSTFTGGVTIGALSTTGNTTLGDTSGDLLTLTGTAISIPNNLNIDSNTLYVDATNNRVGVGKTNPATALDVTGTVTATAFAGALTGAVTGNVTGNVTGDVTGNVTGNVTGSSGSCTGNAATATNVAYSGLTGTVPTWNQDTTGTAANATYATSAGSATTAGACTGNSATATLATTATALSTATGSAPSYAARAYANINAGTVVNITGSYSRTSPSTSVIVTTASAHPFRVGDTAYLNFTSGTGLDGVYTIVSTSSNTNFTVTTAASTTTAGNITIPTVAIRKAGNVSSVTASTTGTTASLYYINFTTDMPDANYAPTVTVSAGTVAVTGTTARTLTVDTGSSNVSIIGLAVFD